MSEPADPFDSWSHDGLEEALESFEDEETRDLFRKFALALDAARLDAPALVDQAGPMSVMRGVMALDDGRARAVLYWLVLGMKQVQLGSDYEEWVRGGE